MEGMMNMKIKKMMTMALAGAILMGSLVGCGGKDTATADGNTSQKQEATQGEQIINLAIGNDPQSLDATLADESIATTVALETQEGLVRYLNGKVEPAGAESWTVSEDGLVWTFNIRDYNWSDGKPVTAQDFEYAIKRVFDPELVSHMASIFYVIEGGEAYNTGAATADDVMVKSLDEKTLEITLTKPVPYFVELMNFACVVPARQDIIEAAGSTYGTEPEGMVFSGPFVVDQWVRGSKIVLKKNENYWDKENVFIDQANLLFVPEEQTRQQMFDSGALDVIREVRGEYADFKKPQVESGEIIKIEGAAPSAGYIAFNNKDPEGIFTNANMRKAFSIALDRESYITHIAKKDQPAYGWIPYGVNSGDAIFRDVVADPLLEIKDEDPLVYLHKGMEELGLDKNKQLEVTFLQSNSNTGTRVRGEYYQNQWEEKLGVKVNIETAADNATFNKMVGQTAEYQLAQTGWGGDYNDPMTFMQNFMTGDGNNAAHFSNARYDELIEACMVEQDMAKRLDMFAEAERIIVLEEAAMAPLTYNLTTSFTQNYIKNYPTTVGVGPQYELKGVSIEK